MNRKFFLSGVIVTQLMQTHGISSLDLSQKLKKTRQAIYDLQKRKIIKDADAFKILAAFGLSFEEVKKMDSEGVFSIDDTAENLIDSFENPHFTHFLAKIENMYDELNEQYSKELNRLHQELIKKDLVIQAKNKIIVAFVESMSKNSG